jgi:Kef-type K+ transport system membrane component KefB
MFSFKTLESSLVATALTATSIAISIQVLTELGKIQSKEARLILGAAVVDDILAIAALSVVTTMVQTGNTSPDIVDVAYLVLKILGVFAALLIGSVFIVPRILVLCKNILTEIVVLIYCKATIPQLNQVLLELLRNNHRSYYNLFMRHATTETATMTIAKE